MKDKQRPGLGDQCISSRLVHFTPSKCKQIKEKKGTEQTLLHHRVHPYNTGFHNRA